MQKLAHGHSITSFKPEKLFSNIQFFPAVDLTNRLEHAIGRTIGSRNQKVGLPVTTPSSTFSAVLETDCIC